MLNTLRSEEFIGRFSEVRDSLEHLQSRLPLPPKDNGCPTPTITTDLDSSEKFRVKDVKTEESYILSECMDFFSSGDITEVSSACVRLGVWLSVIFSLLSTFLIAPLVSALLIR